MSPKSKKPYKKAYLEITNVCNLSCAFCPKTSREPRFVSVEEFSSLIEQVQPLTDYVYLHLMGEPLLHPQLGQILALCHRAGLKVSLTTNGTLLEKRQELLLCSPALYRVSVSLHSFEANDSHQTLEEYVQGALQFCAAAGRSSVQPICVLRLWNRDSAVLKASNQRNVDIFQQVRQFFALPFDPAEALEQRASVKLADRVYLETAEKFAWPDIEQADLSDEVFCYGLRDQFGVLADGTVVPCCLDSDGNIPLGNVHTQPLTEILCSPRAKALYEGFPAAAPPRPSAAAAATPSATPDSKAPIRSPFSPAGGGAPGRQARSPERSAKTTAR